MKYKTKNSKKLISFLEDHSDEHLNMKQIHEMLPDIPQATLYRLMDDLEKSGQVRKYVINSNSGSCYQYIENEHCHEHFHLICERCGKLMHLECDETEQFLQHIRDEHGFDIDVSKINFYGLCDECKSEAKK